MIPLPSGAGRLAFCDPMVRFNGVSTPIHWSRCVIKPSQCGVANHAPGYYIPPRWFHEAVTDFDLWVVFKGSAELRVNGGAWDTMVRGSCCWLRPGESFEFRVTGFERLEMGFVHFDCATPEGRILKAEEVQAEALRCEATDPHLFEFGIRRLFYLHHRLRDGKKGAAKWVEAQMSHLTRTLLDEYAYLLAELRHGVSNGLDARHLQVTTAATAWIYQHPDLNCSMEELAARFGYNARYFCRIFQQQTGRTPRQVVIQAKIDHAKQLLAQSAMNVGEIAESLGYTNIYYFSRQFTKEVGLSPTDYRLSTRRSPGNGKKVKKDKKNCHSRHGQSQGMRR